MSNLIAWIIRAIPFGTIIMFGSMGEITTEKSGNLNLGIPGIMYLGGFAGFASSYFYEKNAADPKGWICVLLALTAAIAASMLGGLIFSFLTISVHIHRKFVFHAWISSSMIQMAVEDATMATRLLPT